MQSRHYVRVILLVIIGLILNLGISSLVKYLECALPLDHVGTILTAILGGPFIGILVGLSGSLLTTVLAGYGFELVDVANAVNGAILGGLIGWLTVKGGFRSFRKTVCMGIAAVIVYTLIIMLNVTYVRMAGFGMSFMASLAEACSYPLLVIKDLFSTFWFVFLDKFFIIIIIWTFFKLTGALLPKGFIRNQSTLPVPINIQKLGTKLAEIPIFGPIWKKIVRLITIIYLDYIAPLQKGDEGSGSISSVQESTEEERYMFNQYRGYGFRLPENISEWNKVKVQLVIGTIQFAGANHDLLNKETVAQELGLSVDEVTKRIVRMYNDHLLLVPTDAALQTVGFALFYMVVKLKKGTSDKRKQEISAMIRDNDYACTSFETAGDYDFFIGAHITTIDNLYKTILKGLYALPELEELTLLPVQRMLRQERLNHWDMKKNLWRETALIDGELGKLATIQNALDKTDLTIIEILMKKREITDYLNVNFLSKKKETGEKVLRTLDGKRLFVSPVFLNWMKLNYQPYFFTVKFSDKTNSDQKIELSDHLVETYPEFNLALQVTDTYYDLFLGSYQGLADIEATKKALKETPGVAEVKEMVATRQHRMWTTKLSEENWGECVMMWE